MIGLFLACVRGRDLENPVPIVTLEPTRLPSGRIEGGRYYDTEFHFSVALPSGWVGEPGKQGDALRARFFVASAQGSEKKNQSWVGVYVPEKGLGPPVHEGCSWNFQDIGHHGGEVGTLIAHCTPESTGLVTLVACRWWGAETDPLGVCMEANIASGSLKDLRELPSFLLSSLQAW